jgi:HD-like signal output (HDOD) protein
MSEHGLGAGNRVVANALSSLGEIATLPDVAVKIIEVTEEPTGDAAALREVIRRDSALSAKVLNRSCSTTRPGRRSSRSCPIRKW